ncbi:MAG: type II toxin-antitoxin system YhaV family toxin [Paracoccaceae bacterium]|nr:type II toxin-antitoxin system YhaV family toxin [Paracoccaceae bacterium]
MYAHPIFLDQLDGLIKEVETHKVRTPTTWKKRNRTKRLVAVFKLMTEVIATDPGALQFRQDSTLGRNRKHGFRAKFIQQCCLFFRFVSAAKVIVLTWVNDEGSLRAYPGRTDAYATFKKMLDGGNPPDNSEDSILVTVEIPSLSPQSRGLGTGDGINGQGIDTAESWRKRGMHEVGHVRPEQPAERAFQYNRGRALAGTEGQVHFF